MLNSKTTLETINEGLNKYLIDPISQTLSGDKEQVLVETKKASESKNVKFSYPKNGLYGLL